MSVIAKSPLSPYKGESPPIWAILPTRYRAALERPGNDLNASGDIPVTVTTIDRRRMTPRHSGRYDQDAEFPHATMRSELILAVSARLNDVERPPDPDWCYLSDPQRSPGDIEQGRQ